MSREAQGKKKPLILENPPGCFVFPDVKLLCSLIVNFIPEYNYCCTDFKTR
jgi:hypothetical protein